MPVSRNSRLRTVPLVLPEKCYRMLASSVRAKYHALIFIILPEYVIAADIAPGQGEAISYGQIVNLMAGLVIVLLAFFCIAYTLKRFSGMGGVSRGHLRIVDALPVSTREKLMLVKVADTYLLLGVSPGSINTLHVLDETLEEAGIKPAGDFKTQLQNLFINARVNKA